MNRPLLGGLHSVVISPTDKDYDFSVDPEIITLVESDPFYAYESKTVVDILLN